jgi:hypothetical protein
MGEMNKNECSVCGQTIQVMCFRGEGFCCELHRKVGKGELDREVADSMTTIGHI